MTPLTNAIKDGAKPTDLYAVFVKHFAPVISNVGRYKYDPASTIADIYKWLLQTLEKHPGAPQPVWLVFYFFAEYVTPDPPNLLQLARSLQPDSLLVYPLLAQTISTIRKEPASELFGPFGFATNPGTGHPVYPSILSRGMENIVLVVEHLGRSIRRKTMGSVQPTRQTKELVAQGTAGMAMCANAHLGEDGTGFTDDWTTPSVLRLGAPEPSGFAAVDEHVGFSRYTRVTLAFAPWYPDGASVLAEFDLAAAGEATADPNFSIRCPAIKYSWMRILFRLREYMWLFVHQIRTVKMAPLALEQKALIVGSIIELMGVLAPRAIPYSDYGYMNWASQHPPDAAVHYEETRPLLLGGAVEYLKRLRLIETVPPIHLLLYMSLDVLFHVHQQGQFITTACNMEPNIGRTTSLNLYQVCERNNYVPLFVPGDLPILRQMATRITHSDLMHLFGDHPLRTFWKTVLDSAATSF